MPRTTSTRARSLRALTTTAALITLGLAGSAALADGPHGNNRGRVERQADHANENGGVLWIGSRRFSLASGHESIERLAGELRRGGYRVTRFGDELTITAHDRLGGLRYSTGAFRSVITTLDRYSFKIRFDRIGCGPVVVKPITISLFRPIVHPGVVKIGLGLSRDNWDRRDRDHQSVIRPKRSDRDSDRDRRGSRTAGSHRR